MIYVIDIPGPWHQSAGVRALHVLKSELQARGLEAVMSYEGGFSLDDAYVLYPEVTPGNPRRAPRWGTWMLNLRGPLPPGERFAWSSMISHDPLLAVDVIESHLWWPQPRRTNTVGVWEGKGRIDWSKCPPGAVQITHKSHPTREGLSDFVRSLDSLVSFDPFSTMNLEAACAGVPVRIFEDGKWTREQVESIGWMPFGAAWEDDEMPEARASVHLARSFYFDKIVPLFGDQIDRFVRLTS